jgi:hypothetical protein
MGIGRSIIIPAIIALGVAGSTVAGSAIAVAGGHLQTHVSGTHVQADGLTAIPDIYWHA